MLFLFPNSARLHKKSVFHSQLSTYITFLYFTAAKLAFFNQLATYMYNFVVRICKIPHILFLFSDFIDNSKRRKTHLIPSRKHPEQK